MCIQLNIDLTHVFIGIVTHGELLQIIIIMDNFALLYHGFEFFVLGEVEWWIDIKVVWSVSHLRLGPWIDVSS